MAEVENETIKQIRDELTKMCVTQWSLVYANFGVSLWHIENRDEYSGIDINLPFIKNVKGINYGQYETPTLHPCVILNKMTKTDKEFGKTIIVAPITSVTGKPLRYDVHIEARRNPFLLNDSYVRLSSMKSIGYERIDMKTTQRATKRNTLYLLDTISREAVKKEISEMMF